MEMHTYLSVFNEDRSVIRTLVVRINQTVKDDHGNIQYYDAETLPWVRPPLPYVPEDDPNQTWRRACDVEGNEYRVDASYDDENMVYKIQLFPEEQLT